MTMQGGTARDRLRARAQAMYGGKRREDEEQQNRQNQRQEAETPAVGSARDRLRQRASTMGVVTGQGEGESITMPERKPTWTDKVRSGGRTGNYTTVASTPGQQESVLRKGLGGKQPQRTDAEQVESLLRKGGTTEAVKASKKTGGKFDVGEYSKQLGRQFLSGIAEGGAATLAAGETLIGKGLDKLFPGAGFEGSGVFNALYHGRPDWKLFGENGLPGVKKEREYTQGKLAENIENIDTGSELGDKVAKKAASFGSDAAYGTGNALPMAVEAIFSGGKKALSTLGSLGANVVQKSGLAGKLEEAAKLAGNTLRSREYWTSFLSEVGMDYYEALDNGATDDEATRYALSSALVNSVIEIGGGIQKIPEAPTFRTWIKGAHEEGMEEIQQGIVSRLMENVVYDKKNPLVSVTDENAVVNPVTAANEYAGGFAVGGLLGGVQQGMAKRAQTRQEAELAQYQENLDKLGEEFTPAAKEMAQERLSLDSEDYTAQRVMNALDSGEAVSGEDIRTLILDNVKARNTAALAEIKEKIAQRLTDLGETKDANAVADAMVRYFTVATRGNDKSSRAQRAAEQETIFRSRYGDHVSQELMQTENVPQWVQGLPRLTTVYGYEQAHRPVAEKQTGAEAPAEQEAETAVEQGTDYTEQSAEPEKLTSDIVRKAAASRETLEQLGIDPQGKTGSQLRAEVRKALTERQDVSQEVQQRTQAAQQTQETQEAAQRAQGTSVTLEDASKAYGKQAKAFLRTYQQGQDVEKFSEAYRIAHEMGKSDVPYRVVQGLRSLDYLTEAQKDIAYRTGASAEKQESGGKNATWRRQGVVRAENGANLSDLSKTFNVPQKQGYRILSDISKATGVDIVLYRSKGDAEGNITEAEGRFRRSENTIYIDVNSGIDNVNRAADFSQYTMLRTFNHEFTHFIEQNAAEEYRELRKLVFEAMQEKLDGQGNGVTVDDLIREKQDKYRQALGQEISYDEASREVVADAMTDILPDSHFMETLYNRNATLAEKLIGKLKDFIAKVKAYFDGLTTNTKAEAALLKEMRDGGLHYLERIVEAYDKAATAAVENYQGAETRSEGGDENGRIHSGQHERNAGGVAERGTENQRGVKDQFLLREPVEETRDLLALHNMTADNLRGALKLGGLPMPSIAIVKAAAGHSKYGPISVVFEKSTIDPQADRRNKVYGGDAYTPTAPKVEYPVNDRAMRKVEKHLAELSGQVAGGIFLNDTALRRLGIEDESSMNADALAERLARDDSVQAAYLADSGKALEPVRQPKEFSKFGNGALQQLVSEVGVQDLARINAEMQTGNYAAVREIEGTIRDIIRSTYEVQHRGFLDRKPELKQKRIAHYMENNVNSRTVEDFALNAWNFYQDNGATTDEIDRWATADKLHEMVTQDQVKAWLRPQLEGLLGEAGIYNGKERYTSSGNQRSFAQTHYAYTLENIVRAMAETQKERGGQTFGVTAKTMQAVSTPSYDSIAAIKADSGRLGAVEGEAYDAAVQKVETQIEQAIRKVMRENKPHSDNQFDEMEIIGEVMMEAAKGTKTEAAIQRAFQKEDYTISKETAKMVQKLFRDAAALPTEYFEAKPQRAVPFNEAAAVVVPDDLPAGLKKGLEELGATVREYKAGDEQSRLEAVNAIPDVQFSIRDSEGRILTEAQQDYFKDSKVRDADGNLLVMYHQTDGTFTVFDTKHKGAGAGDDETPFGIFLKRTPRNIGVRGEKQMELYANIRNPLRVRDRTELVSKLRELSVDYARLKDESAQIDKEYGAKFEEAKNAFKSFLIQWRKNNPDAPPRAAYDADGFDDAFNAEDNVVKEWTRVKDELAMRAKTAITQALRDNGYDGVFLENDKGSWGRSTDAYIALDANQVKNTTNKSPTADPDIRYSIREIAGKVMPVLDTQKDTRNYSVAEAYLKTLVDTEHPFSTILMDAQPVYIGRDLPGEYRSSKYTKTLRKSIRDVKMQAATNLDEMLLLAENGEWHENIKEKHKVDAKNGWYRYSTQFAVPVLDIKKSVDHYTVYSGTLLIRNDADGKSYLYDLLDIKKEKVISSASFSARGHSEVFEPKPSQTQYTQDQTGSQAQIRSSTLSDRDVLRIAAQMAKNSENRSLTDADRARLGIIEQKLGRIDEAEEQRQGFLEEKRAILAGREAKELSDAERAQLRKVQKNLDTVNGKIRRLNEELSQTQEKKVVKELLKKARVVVERDAVQRSVSSYRETRQRAEYMGKLRRSVERNAKRLQEMLLTNTDKKHVPEALKKPVAELLRSMNLISKRGLAGGAMTKADERYVKALRGIQDVLARQSLYEENGKGDDLIGGYLDLPAGFQMLLNAYVSKVEKAIEEHPLRNGVLQTMTVEELEETNTVLSVISTAVTEMNKLMVNRQFATVVDAAEDTIWALNEHEQHQRKTGENFLVWDNCLPWYAFQRFGEGGKSIFQGLMNGWDKLSFNTKKVLDFRNGLIDDKTARKWDTETHTVMLENSEGGQEEVTLTTAQLMSLYCLSRRKQAMGHLMGGGIRVASIDIAEEIESARAAEEGNPVREKKKKKKDVDQAEHYLLTQGELGRLLSLLTPEQVQAAKAMQKYMTEQGSAWGNEVSMRRFGYRAFTEENYFPIETDSQDRPAKTDSKEGSLYRLLNLSAVKPLTEGANNAIMVRSIFDVFANHMADMAKYNALALPVLDAQKWYNYKDSSKNKDNGQVRTRTVQRAITRAWGSGANNYVVTFLKDINGVKENGARGEGMAAKAISKYKRAAVAANLRVAMLQPTSYVRASAVIDHKYLAKALTKKVITKAERQEMLQYSGVALWKEMGFFDTDVGRSIRDRIKGKGSKIEDLVDKSMAAAQAGDKITWERLWLACKLEVEEKRHLTGEELMEATAERFREVIYRTQVVDSTMTRSHMMRDGGTFSKIATSFMSESTVSYNMLMNSTLDTLQDAQSMGMQKAVKKNWRQLGLAYQAYILAGAASAIAGALADALRDWDDDTFLEKFWKAFWGEKPEKVRDQVLNLMLGLEGNLAGELNPLGKIPLIRDVTNTLGGFSTDRMDMAAWSNLYSLLGIWEETIGLWTGSLDKATKTTYYGNMTTYNKIYKTAQVVSQFTGLPISATMRELVTMWNSTVGLAYPGTKVRTYESRKVREAYEQYGKSVGLSYVMILRAAEAVRQLESDKDEDGNAISGSLKKKYVEYIQSLHLSAKQEKAMWNCIKKSSWSDKDTPWGK